MKKHRLYPFLAFLVLLLCFSGIIYAQNNTNENRVFNNRQQHIVTISSFTAKGDLQRLQKALHDGLDAGLTINEIKELIVHLYAYCGFPRSLQGINTFIAVIDARRAKGITDKVGKEATPLKNSLSKYERGKKTLETLTSQPEREPKTGYAVFSPVIDTFLKEHLFADIFSRDILSYAEREIATISSLISLGGVEPMLQGHIRIALNLGMTESELSEILYLIETKVGKEEAEAGRRVLSTMTNSNAWQNATDAAKSDTNIFIKGVRAPATNFTGTVWVNMLVQAQDGLDCSIGAVTFEPGARTHWHMHPGSQVLLVTEGKGYYQERGKSIRLIQKGNVVKCPPKVAHWHGASPDTQLTHIAIATEAEKGNVAWMQKVTDEEYHSKEK